MTFTEAKKQAKAICEELKIKPELSFGLISSMTLHLMNSYHEGRRDCAKEILHEEKAAFYKA